MVKEKNWLIRTSNYQILGPVSKEKIIEFVDKGSLKGDDEVTSGNGYWFLIKEKDLLDKYVYGDIPQTFNPITEAPNVLTANQSSEKTGTHNKIPNPTPVAKSENIDINLPDDGDLEYPDMNLPTGDDLDYPDLGTPSGELSLDALDITPDAPSAKSPKPTLVSSEDEGEGLLPDDTDLEYPDMGELLATPSEDAEAEEYENLSEFDEETDPSVSVSDFEEETDPGIIPVTTIEDKVAPEPVASVKTPVPPPSRKLVVKHKPIEEVEEAPSKKRLKKTKKPQRNDKLLFVLTGLFFVALLFAAVIFYYKKVLNKPLPIIGANVIQLIMPSAVAQTGLNESLVKKKTFLIFKI